MEYDPEGNGGTLRARPEVSRTGRRSVRQRPAGSGVCSDPDICRSPHRIADL